MVFFSRNKKIENTAYHLFTKVVDQARQPFFYENWGVADTLDGRFDLIVLHLSLVVNRLESHEKDKQIPIIIRYAQEALFANMDMSLREMGVGDMSVGKKVKVMAEAYFGRKSAYSKAIASENIAEDIKTAIIRNIYRDQAPDGVILDQFVSYIMAQIDGLDRQTVDDMVVNGLCFEEVK